MPKALTICFTATPINITTVYSRKKNFKEKFHQAPELRFEPRTPGLLSDYHSHQAKRLD